MIDSVALAWGQATGSAVARVNAPKAGRRRPNLAEPVHLDMADLSERLGHDDGQVTAKAYKAGSHIYGHWKEGDVELLYRAGRLELRASLPKLVAGRNDVVLDERGVHEGLAKLVAIGSDLAQYPLDLREAVPMRLDYCYQWNVPSVAWIVEHLRASNPFPRKLRTENVSPFGGLSLIYGYRTKRVMRFYDKGAEVFDRERKTTHYEHGIPLERLQQMTESGRRSAIATAIRAAQQRAFKAAGFDTSLRFEIQERRPGRTDLIHENGYRAEDVRRELTETVATIGRAAQRGFAAYLDTFEPGSPNAIAYAAAGLYLAEHPADLAVIRNRYERHTFYNWRRRSREAAAFLQVGDWTPEIPPDAFAGPSPLWAIAPAVAA